MTVRERSAFYIFPKLDTSMWYFALNVPIMLLGLKMVSRRFVLYSLYGIAAGSTPIELLVTRA